jgi:hypothetical protein
MFLDKLNKVINNAEAVDVKVKALLDEVQKFPETIEELKRLISHTEPTKLLDSMPDVNIDAIHAQLSASKQVLVATNDYYYI